MIESSCLVLNVLNTFCFNGAYCYSYDTRHEGPLERYDAILEIVSAAPHNSGLYSCRARSAAGTAEKRIQLLVDTLPQRGDITGEATIFVSLSLTLFKHCKLLLSFVVFI